MRLRNLLCLFVVVFAAFAVPVGLSLSCEAPALQADGGAPPPPIPPPPIPGNC